MKKIIILSILSLMSCVYALENKVTEKSSEPITKTQTEINQSYLYEFNFSSVGQKDSSVHKYMTNNTDGLATLSGLQEVLRNNWHLGNEYSKNIKFKSESKVLNQLVCKYNNGLVIKIKPYGDYSTTCPLSV